MLPRDLVATVVHELSHACVGRHFGAAIVAINVTHSGAPLGFGSRGCVRLRGGAGQGVVADAINQATHLFAGEIGADLLTLYALEAYPDPLPGEDQPAALIETVIADLPPDVAEDAIDRQSDPATEVEATDEEQARFWVGLAAPGDEFWPLYEYCRRRARRFVLKLAPTILGLVPAVIARPIMSGHDFEAAIEALADDSAATPEGTA